MESVPTTNVPVPITNIPVPEELHITGWPKSRVESNRFGLICQTGVIDRGKEHALFVGFNLVDGFDEKIVKNCLSKVPKWTSELLAQYSTPIVSVIGIDSKIWRRFDANPPRELRPFEEIKNKNTEQIIFPADGDELFLIVKCDRLDLCNILSDLVLNEFRKAGLASFSKTVAFTHLATKNYRFNLGRDLTGFIDGTRNTFFNFDIACDSAIMTETDEKNETHIGGSFMYVSKFIHDMQKYNTLNNEEKSNIFGRDITKEIGPNIPENPRLPDNKDFSNPKVNKYHINRSYGAMYRQSMPFISGDESGLLFLAFSGGLSEMSNSLLRMAGHFAVDGSLDSVFDITRSVKNGFYYCPHIRELELLYSD